MTNSTHFCMNSTKITLVLEGHWVVAQILAPFLQVTGCWFVGNFHNSSSSSNLKSKHRTLNQWTRTRIIACHCISHGEMSVLVVGESGNLSSTLESSHENHTPVEEDRRGDEQHVTLA